MEYIIMAVVIFYILSAVIGRGGKAGSGRTPPPGQGQRRAGPGGTPSASGVPKGMPSGMPRRTPSGMPSFGGLEIEMPVEVKPARENPRELSEPKGDEPIVTYDTPREASKVERTERNRYTAALKQELNAIPSIADQDLTKGEIGSLPAEDDEEIARQNAANHPLFNKNSIVHGVIWSEILSPPKSRRGK